MWQRWPGGLARRPFYDKSLRTSLYLFSISTTAHSSHTLNDCIHLWATTCMRGISRSYNAGKTHGVVRFEKTNNHCPLAEGYDNFPRPCPRPATIRCFFSVNQLAVTRLGKGYLRMSVIIMVISSERQIWNVFHKRGIYWVSPVGNVNPCFRWSCQATHRL